MGIIKAFKLGFDYLKYDEDGNVQDTQRAVNDVNLDIEAGQFVAVLGHNGSGKSTLAKSLNYGKSDRKRAWFFRILTIRS